MSSMKGIRKVAAGWILLTAMVLSCVISVSAGGGLDEENGFYLKQSKKGNCTLTSATMMLRRQLFREGNWAWSWLSENDVASVGWQNGLMHFFTCNGMTVIYTEIPNLMDKRSFLADVLKENPEGIVLYDRTSPHAILLTDYTDGVFYCADPARNINEGRIPLENASITIEKASCYWYVK